MPLLSLIRDLLYFLKKRKEGKGQKAFVDDLEKMIVELEASRKELKENSLVKEDLAMIIAHDIQSPLRFISAATDRLSAKLSQGRDEEAAEICQALQQTSKNIYGFVEDFALWVGTMSSNFRMQNSQVDLYDLASELQFFFEQLMKSSRNRMELEVDPSLSFYTNRQLLKIVLRNIIDNANKHTTDGIIRVMVSGDQVCISDTGEGMSEEVMFRNKQTSERANQRGYNFIHHFCELLDIKIAIDSKPGQGTIVCLSNFKVTA